MKGVYAVRERELRRKRNGEPWLRLVLGDASGSAEAVAWEDAEALYALAAPGTAVEVAGVFEMSERWGAEDQALRSARGRRRTSTTPPTSRPSRTSPSRTWRASCASCWRRCRSRSCATCSIASSARRSEIWARFRDAPAAKVYHQAYRHGLLEHTVSVAQAVSAAANFFPGIDREVAVAGALLHDIGKTVAYNDDPLAIDLTDAGRLQGEIPLGYYTVRREIEEIPGFDPAPGAGGPPHHPQPPRLARTRLAGRPRHPRGRPRPHDRQPRRPPRQLRSAGARSCPPASPGRASTALCRARPISAAAKPPDALPLEAPGAAFDPLTS